MNSDLLILLTTEQARCRNVALHYTAMGSIGYFAAAMLEELQRQADHAIIHGQEADIRSSLTALQAVRQPPQTCSSAMFVSPALSPSFGLNDGASSHPKVKPTLASSVANAGRRSSRFALASGLSNAA